MKRLGIDLDGVTVDFTAGYHSLIKELFGLKFERQDQTDWDAFCLGLNKEQDDMLWKSITQKHNFWLTLRPLEGTDLLNSIALNSKIQNRECELFFITSRVDTKGWPVQEQSATFLEEWFHMRSPQVLLANDPGQKVPLAKALKLDAFIDDKPSTVVQMHEAGLRSYCRLQPWNKQKSYPEGVILVETLNKYLEVELGIGQ